MTTHNASTSARGSQLRFILVPAVFVIAYFAARAGLERVEPGTTRALAIALAPVPVFAWLVWSFARGVRSMDELGRRIQLEALALAFPVALVVVFAAGLLELGGFEGRGNWDLPRLWPLLLLPYWFGLARANKRYA